MANERRMELQNKLEELLGSRNVYYQPPESINMKYDAIIYSLGVPEERYANNKRYMSMSCYDLIVISVRPDPDIVDLILESFQYTSPGKPYVAANLNHYPIKLYY